MERSLKGQRTFATQNGAQLLTPMHRIEKSLREDIAALKASPLIKKGTNIIGLAYDIDTGLLSEVRENESGL